MIQGNLGVHLKASTIELINILILGLHPTDTQTQISIRMDWIDSYVHSPYSYIISN